MTFNEIIENAAFRLDATIVLDEVRNYLDKAYTHDAFKFYRADEIAMAIYYDIIAKKYDVEVIDRAFNYATYEYDFLKGLERAAFEKIRELAAKDYKAKIDDTIASIPTFGNDR